MSSVYFSNPYNSTFFTTCCNVAIGDQMHKCPACKGDVYPFYEGMTDSERDVQSSGYDGSDTRRARWDRAGARGYGR